MDLYIYSDESGSFDYVHNDYFIFGGIICFSKEERDILSRKYSHAEKVVKPTYVAKGKEIKGSNLTKRQKSKLYRSLNNTFKFCLIIKQKKLEERIFENKKHKQRYLDFAYKLVLKKCFESLINSKVINPKEIKDIYVYPDEHSTATDGLYELRESLLNEFKIGTFNNEWNIYYEPIFPNVHNVEVKFCSSKKVFLVRAADIICNRCFNLVRDNKGYLDEEYSLFIYYLPSMLIANKGIKKENIIYLRNPQSNSLSE